MLSPTAGLRVSGGPIPISLTTLPNGELLILATGSSGEVLNSSLTAQPDGRYRVTSSQLVHGASPSRFAAQGDGE